MEGIDELKRPPHEVGFAEGTFSSWITGDRELHELNEWIKTKAMEVYVQNEF